MKAKLIVMKFGGTSVADPEKIYRAAEKAISARKKGLKVVVVVSAPGEMTDDLLSLAHRVTPDPDARELDMLLSTGEQVSIALFAMALKSRGWEAVSLTGPQAGILADERHTRAHITGIRPEKIIQELARDRIVAVAGFQGVNPKADITTLGRGGSDLSAVALAAALKAEHCEIYTDVNGVYTADPRIVPEAGLIEEISCEEMLELAGAGSQVMQARSIELARKFGVKIHVRSAFDPRPGTWIIPKKKKAGGKKMEEATVSSLALDKNEVKLTIVGVPDRPGVAALVLSEMARGEIPIDMIVQSSASRRTVNDISFMTPRGSAGSAREALLQAAKRLGARQVDTDERVAKISVVGTGFKHHPWVAEKVFETLAGHKINIQMISTSDLKISCVIAQDQADEALKALHRAFGLYKIKGRGAKR